MHLRQDGAPVLYTPPKNQTWEGYHWDLREGSGRMPNDAVQGLRFRPQHTDRQKPTPTHTCPLPTVGRKEVLIKAITVFLMSLDI